MLEWREGLTVDALVRDLGGAEGMVFASIEDSTANGLRRRFVSRRDWPATTIEDGAKVKLVAAASGG
jgi:sulfur carrier protein ThiS